MPSPEDLEREFWKALKSDRTLMLGLSDAEGVHPRPMTANLDGDEGPIWIFTATDTELAQSLSGPKRAIATFASKKHSIFATMHGTLMLDNDRAVIDRLWSPFIAAWFEGKDDPKLALLRFDLDEGEIWENDYSLLAGIKMMLGVDPKKDYRDKVAEVDLRSARRAR